MTLVFQSSAVTTSARVREFTNQFPEEAKFLIDRMTTDFYRSVWTQAVQWGRMSDKQLAAVRRGMAKARGVAHA